MLSLTSPARAGGAAISRHKAELSMAPHPPICAQSALSLTARDSPTMQIPKLGSAAALPALLHPYSQHTEAVDPRDALAVPQQVAAISTRRQQQLLPSLSSDAPVVDGQRFHGLASCVCTAATEPSTVVVLLR